MVVESLGCLDADAVLEVVEDRVPEDRRAGVDAHLDECAECRQLVIQLADCGLSTGSGARTRGLRGPVGIDSPALVAGRYRVTGLVGRGGMGVVLSARHVDGGPEIALKRLPRANANAQGRRRFIREAEAVRALDHPAVVRVLDFGEDEHGDLYLAMERLDGEDLGDRLAHGPLPPSEVIRLGLEAASGLGAAHQAGIVHRDVKPSNLFCCSDGRVTVLDFGLALVVAEAIEPRLTLSGRLMGTPAYMAVEQVQATRLEDERTDVWGLGATLYHALAGRPPFSAPSTTSMLVRIAMEEPDPLPPGAPAELGQVILQALRKDRAERHRDMAAFAEALCACADAARGVEAAARAPSIPPVLGEVRLVAALVAVGTATEEARAAVQSAMERHGGTATVLRGGKIAGLFGHAEWIGDESQRAALAALEAAPWCGAVGVGTGTATWRPDEVGTVAGTAIAAAEEAMRAGAPLGVCPETRRRLLGSFELVGARLLRERDEAEPAGSREITGVEIPMLGRDAELLTLRGLVGRVRRESHAQTALIVGPPGIGKSRLLRELRAWIEEQPEPVTLLAGRGEASSYGTIGAALRHRAALPAGAPIEVARARIAAMVASAGLSGPAAHRTTEALGQLLGVRAEDGSTLASARGSTQELGDRIRRAVGDLFEAWTATAPVILLLEDVHAADPASLDLVELLASRLSDRPFATIATSRHAVPLPGARRIELGEIGLADAETIVERILGRPAPALARRAGGTPFFAEELSLAVREGADPASLPLTVQGAVQARLDALSEAERDTLKRAAVLGTRFWTEALIALGRRDAREVLPSLRRRDLVVPRPDGRLAGVTEWTFRHALLREVAYGMLVPDQLRILHLRAAAWLGARPDVRPDEVATHYEAGGDPERATRLWIDATWAAQACGDSRAVVAASDRLVGAGATAALEPAEEHRLRLARVEALSWLGRGEAEDAELDELASLEGRAAASRSPLPPAARAQTLRRRAYSLERRGRYEEALPWARAALELAEGVDAPTAAAARTVLAFLLVYTGRLAEARIEADAAVAATERCGEELEWCRAKTARSVLELVEGNVVASLESLRAVAARAEANGSGRETARASQNVGWGLLALGDLTAARTALEKAASIAHALGIPIAEGYARSNLAFVLGRLGETEAALASTAQAIQIAGSTDRPQLFASAHMYRALIETEAGGPEAGLADADEAMRWITTHRFVLHEPPGRLIRAMALRALGRREEALTECQSALELRRRAGGMEQLEIDLLVVTAELLDEHGRSGEAAAVWEEAHTLFEERRARIADPHLRRTFSENVPAHVRLQARGAGR